MVSRKKVLNPRETTTLCRVETGLGPVNLLHACYVTHTFAPHFHEGYCLGVIEAGALGFRYRGEEIVAPAGAVNLAIPGEVHTGRAAHETGWTYRMFYLDADLLAHAATQLSTKRFGRPFIREGVLFDPDLATMIRRLHRGHDPRPLPQFRTRPGRQLTGNLPSKIETVQGFRFTVHCAVKHEKFRSCRWRYLEFNYFATTH